ncbi:MAG TPA: cyanophycinase [Myxococcaceae bacterium]|nr:cyanophycinase [Myxococcaceae bacterium]
MASTRLRWQGWWVLGALVLGAALPAQAQGVVVIAGGGAEGDVGDTTAWSYKLYGELVKNGDRTGDGRIRVAILSTETAPTAFLVDYFKWLGAQEAFTLPVLTRTAANDAAVVDAVRGADVIFIKGGDQGQYYDLWNGTRLETNIRYVVQTLGGAIGGTSAGAMSQAQYAFAGGNDLISADVLTDARTPYLNDVSDGGSGIHNDFLGFVPGVLIDTHCTRRGRLGRLVGLLGKAVQDFAAPGLVAICLEERTGLVIRGTSARAVGVGAVELVQQRASSVLRRDAGRPLYYTNLRLDRLTEGWRYDLSTRLPDTSTRPSTAVGLVYPGDGSLNSGSLDIDGDYRQHEDRFAKKTTYAPSDYTVVSGTGSPFIRGAIGLVDAHNSTTRGAVQETAFRALYDFPSHVVLLVGAGSELWRSTSTPDQVEFARNSYSTDGQLSTLVIDAKTATYKDLSPYTSVSAIAGGKLRAAGFINLTLHALAETSSRGGRYDTVRHTVVGGP